MYISGRYVLCIDDNDAFEMEPKCFIFYKFITKNNHHLNKIKHELFSFFGNKMVYLERWLKYCVIERI